MFYISVGNVTGIAESNMHSVKLMKRGPLSSYSARKVKFNPFIYHKQSEFALKTLIACIHRSTHDLLMPLNSTEEAGLI